MQYLAEDLNSSLIKTIEYDDETSELRIEFVKYYVNEETYVAIPFELFLDMTDASSKGKFYLSKIKNIFPQKLKPQKMADKVLKLKIDVTKINKDFLFTGEKGVYLNCTYLYNEDDDQHGNNGMIVQDVPTKIYKDEQARKVPRDKQTRGAILGNGKEFGKQSGAAAEEQKPGVEAGTEGVSKDFLDDLPF